MAILLGLFLPMAGHVVIEVGVSCRLGDAQPTLNAQTNRFTLELTAVLLAFGWFVLNSHDGSCAISPELSKGAATAPAASC